MKKINKSGGYFRVYIQIFMVISFGVFIVFESQAGSVQKIKSGAASPSSNIPYDETVIDGKGRLDAINFKENSSSKIEARDFSVTINGIEHTFCDGYQLYHFSKQSVTAADLNPGDEVGFKIDPSNNIRELWVIKSDPNKILEKGTQKKTYGSNASPPIGGTVENQNGIWKN